MRKLVRESGLLKDIILLDIPDEAGKFDSVLVRRATGKFRQSHQEWAAYAKQQDGGTPVLPLMVLQVPNTPNPNEIGLALDTIFQEWPELPESSVAHVLGTHTQLTFGRHVVPHISPERVQETNSVRVLAAVLGRAPHPHRLEILPRLWLHEWPWPLCCHPGE